MVKSGFTTAALLAGSVLALSACSTFEPERVSCTNKVTAVELGSRVELTTDDTAQPAEVRLNGVTAQCYQNGAQTVFEVSAGLKVTRDLADALDTTELQVPFLVAVVDADENITDHKSFGYRMAFSKGTDSLYPVVEFDVDAPQGGRVILSMVTQAIELN